MFRWIVAGWLILGSALLMTDPVLAQDSSSSNQDERIPGVVYFEDLSAQHSPDPVEYEMDPPAGGEHHPVWQNCGFYDEFIVPEHAVHSQEHGAVWITFDPELDNEQIAVLEQLAEENSYVLVTPYLDLPSPVVASAWGAQLALDDVEDERLALFIREFAGNGPEPGAPCSGGTSEVAPEQPGGTPVASPVSA